MLWHRCGCRHQGREAHCAAGKAGGVEIAGLADLLQLMTVCSPLAAGSETTCSDSWLGIAPSGRASVKHPADQVSLVGRLQSIRTRAIVLPRSALLAGAGVDKAGFEVRSGSSP